VRSLPSDPRVLILVAWHLAGVIFLFRWIFRDPMVDLRYLAAGALLPDVIDLPLGSMTVSTGQAWFHTLVVPSLAIVLVLVLTGRRGPARKAWMAVGVGMMFHLLLDGMWATREVFFWPLFGWDFPAGPDGSWAAMWDRALADPWRWVREAAGIGYLVWLWIAYELADPSRRRHLLATGRLDASSGPVSE